MIFFANPIFEKLVKSKSDIDTIFNNKFSK